MEIGIKRLYRLVMVLVLVSSFNGVMITRVFAAEGGSPVPPQVVDPRDSEQSAVSANQSINQTLGQESTVRSVEQSTQAPSPLNNEDTIVNPDKDKIFVTTPGNTLKIAGPAGQIVISPGSVSFQGYNIFGAINFTMTLNDAELIQWDDSTLVVTGTGDRNNTVVVTVSLESGECTMTGKDADEYYPVSIK